MMSSSRMMLSVSPFLIGTLMFIVSCSDDTLNNDPTGPGSMALDAATVTNEVIVHEPFESVEFVECADGGTGELVAFTGFFSATLGTTINGSVLSVHMNGVLKLQGEGLSTGDKYQFNNALQANFTESFINEQSSQTFLVGTTAIIGQGPGNDLLARPTLHLTVNANGEVTAEVVQISVECK